MGSSIVAFCVIDVVFEFPHLVTRPTCLRCADNGFWSIREMSCGRIRFRGEGPNGNYMGWRYHGLSRRWILGRRRIAVLSRSFAKNLLPFCRGRSRPSGAAFGGSSVALLYPHLGGMDSRSINRILDPTQWVCSNGARRAMLRTHLLQVNLRGNRNFVWLHGGQR